MPRSKNPDAYPVIYGELLELALETPTKELIHPCNTDTDARRLRFMMYDYLKALNHSTYKQHNELAHRSTTFMLCVEGRNFVMKPRDYTDHALSIQATIERVRQERESAGIKYIQPKPGLIKPISPEARFKAESDTLEDVITKYTMTKKVPPIEGTDNG